MLRVVIYRLCLPPVPAPDGRVVAHADEDAAVRAERGLADGHLALRVLQRMDPENPDVKEAIRQQRLEREQRKSKRRKRIIKALLGVFGIGIALLIVHASTCAFISDVCCGIDCNGHGSCQSNATTYSCNCTAGFVGSTSCDGCAAGRYNPSMGAIACTDCDVGKYVTETASDEASDCIDCHAGKYAEATGCEVCISCLHGTYSATVGATDTARPKSENCC